ncbi:MAG: SDR family oxidoreductase [Chlamydiia bacterium]|nr:SDR family oxidoreductase [Chlamydiia bacterium]
MKRFFVTGHQGYIGAELVRFLKERGDFVTGCDLGLFEGCAFDALVKPDRELNKDIRSLTPDDLQGHDVCIHLAAISNDPMGNLDRTITEEVNYEGSLHVANTAKSAGVQRFIFAGSCSVYGQGAHLDLDENAPFNPITAYASSKIAAERAILSMQAPDFCPVSMRNATAYGSSAMLRLDLVVNNLLAAAYTTGKVLVKSDGTPWRPLIHCRDIALASIAFAEADAAQVSGEAVNVGANCENYQVKEVAALVKKALPDSEIIYTGETGPDPRNYRVNFDKLGALLPHFSLSYTLERGIEELLSDFQRSAFTAAAFENGRFIRLNVLKNRLEMLSSVSMRT